MDNIIEKFEIATIDKFIKYLSYNSFMKILLDKVKNSFILSFNNTNEEYNFKIETRPDPLALENLRTREFILSSKTVENLRGNLRYELLTGMSNNESIDQIKRRLDKIFVTNTVNTERIARSEVIDAMNFGRVEAYKASDIVEYKMWIAAKGGEGHRVCALCASLHGQIQPIDKPFVNPNNHGESWQHPICHPNGRCLYENPLIYTVDGWKPINKIVIGDLVLTHKGRFRVVTEIHKQAKKEPRYKITFYYDRFDNTKLSDSMLTLTVTPEHPFMTDRGWVEAKDLINSDNIQIIGDKCKNCGELYPKIPNGKGENQYYNFCSTLCDRSYTAKDQWENTDMREVVKSKLTGNVISSEIRRKIRDSVNLTYKNHPEIKEIMSNSKKLLYKKYPEKHPNHIMAQKGFESTLEKIMREELENRNINFTKQEHIDKFWIDFAIPELKIAIECDGEFWHKDKEAEINRDTIIKTYGWDILHFTGQQITKDISGCVDSIERLMMNHNDEYNFMWLPIKNIEITKPPKIARMTWNLSVEEDESFIAKSFVVHNCTTVPLMDIPDNVITIGGLMYDADEKLGKIELPIDLLKNQYKTVNKLEIDAELLNKREITVKGFHDKKGVWHPPHKRMIKDVTPKEVAPKEVSVEVVEVEEKPITTMTPENLKELKSFEELGMVGGLHEPGSYRAKFNDNANAMYKVMIKDAIVGEVSTYDVSKILDWDVVPETIETNFEDKGDGSCQKWVDGGNTPYDGFGDEHKDHVKIEQKHFDDLAKIYVLDMVTGNYDRHGGNVMVDENDHCWAIDNEDWGTPGAADDFMTALDDRAEVSDVGGFSPMIRWLDRNFEVTDYSIFRKEIIKNMNYIVKNKNKIINYYDEYKDADFTVGEDADEKSITLILLSIKENLDYIEKYCGKNK